MNLPTPSAWRYTHQDETMRIIGYSYEDAKPKNCNHPNFTPMFTQAQINAYGQACFEEGRDQRWSLAEPMEEVAHRFAHPLALELECVLADRPGYYDKAMQVLAEYRMVMNAIHERNSPTHMGEPVL